MPSLLCHSYLHPSSGVTAALVTAAAGRNHVYLLSKDVQGRFPFHFLPWHFECQGMSVEVKPLLRLFLKAKTCKGQASFVARIVSHLISSV